ncbi:MAG TPA: hypothetical protein VJ841_05445 [Candidatus Saccharimonadales bacterium]|nr:hypothetical protein [Candidatus Saccharimonadales bacterium]
MRSVGGKYRYWISVAACFGDRVHTRTLFNDQDKPIQTVEDVRALEA